MLWLQTMRSNPDATKPNDISGPIYYNILNIFSLNYSKNVAIVSRSFMFSTFGIQTLSHFIKSLRVIKNFKNKT